MASGLRSAPALTPAADALLHTDVPVIAAVNGAAVGWGMELALMADIRVAVGAGQARRAVRAPRAVLRRARHRPAGPARRAGARRRAAVHRPGGRGRRGPALGLVSRVVPHEELLPTALELAGTIAANPPLAVQRLKQGLRLALDPDWHELGAWVSASLGELFQTADHREGVAAFLEKRPARYEGR